MPAAEKLINHVGLQFLSNTVKPVTVWGDERWKQA